MSRQLYIINSARCTGAPVAAKELKVNNRKITDKGQTLQLLAETFKENSDNGNYSQTFQQHKQKAEKVAIDFKTTEETIYNESFLISELQSALSQCHNTSSGLDEVHYEVLKQLPYECLYTLLKVYNCLWFSSNFPESWRTAVIIPIPKPGKDASNPNNYRPISLTSCLCKLFERMINKRLIWFLESKGILSKQQSGFRKHRSTIDHLVKLENDIRVAFSRKQHLVSVFFDLEKAYDMTWRHGILQDLHNIGLRGLLPLFIQQFLVERKFLVKMHGLYSDVYTQTNGVPQGSILSVTLFSLKINNIVSCIPADISCSLYVDDFCIYASGQKMSFIERKLQQYLNKLIKWTDTNGFKFSHQKTQVEHFCRKRTEHNDLELYLEQDCMQRTNEVKFLGVTFDSRLMFNSH